MATTIQIDEKTLKILKQIKEARKAKSYDEVVRDLILEKKASFWGFLGKKPLSKIMENLRDESG